MLTVKDLKGNVMGVFDGNMIRDKEGKVLYWISDNEVYAPLSYDGKDLVHFNKGQFSLVGEYIEGKCLINDDVGFIFD